MALPTSVLSPLCSSLVSSESQSVESSLCSQDNDVYCILKVGEIYRYTTPSFSAITMYLRHSCVQTEDDRGIINVLDIFFHNKTNSFFDIRIPAEVKIFETCSGGEAPRTLLPYWLRGWMGVQVFMS